MTYRSLLPFLLLSASLLGSPSAAQETRIGCIFTTPMITRLQLMVHQA